MLPDLNKMTPFPVAVGTGSMLEEMTSRASREYTVYWPARGRILGKSNNELIISQPNTFYTLTYSLLYNIYNVDILKISI